MTDGPTKPPRFPTELIKAMPAAAENPERNLPGIEKNGPKKLQIPMATNDQSTMDSVWEFVPPSRTRAIPATASGIALWYLRSILRSELRDTRSIAANRARWGTITRTPTTVLEKPFESA